MTAGRNAWKIDMMNRKKLQQNNAVDCSGDVILLRRGAPLPDSFLYHRKEFPVIQKTGTEESCRRLHGSSMPVLILLQLFLLRFASTYI